MKVSRKGGGRIWEFGKWKEQHQNIVYEKKSNKKEVIKTNKYHVVQCCDAMMNLKAVKLNKPGTEDKDHTTSLIYRN